MNVPQSLRDLDDNYQPSDNFARLPDIKKDAPEGLYVCEIKADDLTETQGEVATPIYSLTLYLEQGPIFDVVMKLDFWLGEQDGMDRLGTVLHTLGMDSHLWLAANKRPFSVELVKMIAAHKLIGVRFQGARRSFKKKKLRATDPDEFGQTFDINYLLPPRTATSTPSPSASKAPAPAPTPVRPANARPGPVLNRGGKSSDVPF